MVVEGSWQGCRLLLPEERRTAGRLLRIEAELDMRLALCLVEVENQRLQAVDSHRDLQRLVVLLGKGLGRTHPHTGRGHGSRRSLGLVSIERLYSG